jgi:hypothetical protein
MLTTPDHIVECIRHIVNGRHQRVLTKIPFPITMVSGIVFLLVWKSSITSRPTSPITRLADISLCTAAQEVLAYGYPLGARVAQIALIDVLYECLAFKRHEENQRNLERIAESLYHPSYSDVALLCG